jgi:predicted permease
VSFRRRWRALEEELASHQRLAAADGAPPGSRDRSPEATRERVRDQWAWRWLDDARRDVRFALRGLRRSPGFTLTAVVTLALGIGATAAIFSLVNAILLRPLPYPRPQELFTANQWYTAGSYVYLRDHTRALDLAAYSEQPERYLRLPDGGARPVESAAVSANFLRVMGVTPALGRGFAAGAQRPGQEREVLLSHAFWSAAFHADAGVVGREILLDGAPYAVIGVMPAGFHFPSSKTEMWVPLTLDSASASYWVGQMMPVVGRLRPGFTLAQAKAEQAAWRRPEAEAAPGRMSSTAFRLTGLRPLRTAVLLDVASILWLALGANGLLLAIAGVNVANLLRARAANRTREMELRRALGADRGRLLRQGMTESLLLAALGGAAGVALAAAAVAMLKAWLPGDFPRLVEVRLDGRVVALGVGLALACGGIFGCLPVRGGEPRERRAGGRGRGGPLLVMLEVALSALLVVAAGLTARSLIRLAAFDPGFRPAGVLTARIHPNPAVCRPAARCRQMYHALLQRVQALPGVRAAAVASDLPYSRTEIATFEVTAHPSPAGERHRLAFGTIVSPGYFAAMGIPLERGREFDAADLTGAAAVVISRGAAAQLWPGEEAVGQTIQVDGEPTARRVIGVVGDVRRSALPYTALRGVSEGIYTLYAQPMLPCAPCDTPPENLSLVVRSAPGHPLTAAGLRQAVAEAAPAAAVDRVMPLATAVSAALRGPRTTVWLFAAAAGLALLLGAVGLYGVLAYQVAGRGREIGIRMALGARRATVLAAITGQGLRLAMLGCLAGLAAALAGAQVLAHLLYGFNPRDPLTYAAVAGLWLLVAALASFLPARRASRLDPVRALRCE